ncbi:MAG TPA: hypothetical protein VL947_09395 [Cytophagales bacterium]|nr:hypothetical protein [Cytophagales bacterium]
MWVLCSCNKEVATVEPFMDAKSYCPLNVGDYITYAVEDTLLEFGNVIKPSTFQLKIKVAEKLQDESVKQKFTLERYKRANASEPWSLDSIWFVTYTKDLELVFYEANIPFVKLITPFKTGATWNGNKYNVLQSEIYRTRSFARPYFAQDTLFENTVRIIQNEDFDNLYGYSNNYEVYAKDIGLIYKLYRTYRYSQDDREVPNPNVRVGFIREMRYLSHGKE